MHKYFLLLPLILQFVAGNAQTEINVASGNGAHMQKIGRDVYAIIHDDATDQWPHGNTGVIIGADAVFVVDACYLPSMAREDIRLIKSVTTKPVKYLAITHWHFDHNNGIIAYKDSFPGITVISERESQRYIEINNTWWPKMNTAEGSDKKLSLAQLEKDLSNEKDSTGKIFSADELSKLKVTIAQRKNELEELAHLQVVPPNKVFDGSLTIDLGKRKVELTDQGKANSPHDVTYYVPDAQVLFTGDILVQTPLPFLGASWPLPWVKVLGKLEQIPIKAMVPGHGPVQYDHSYTKQVREYLEAVISRVEAMIRKGMTLDQIKAAINMEDFRKGIWGKEQDRDDWKYNLITIVERAWRGIRGQG